MTVSLHYAAAAGLTVLAVYLLIVGQAILLPFVIGLFVWHLINAVFAFSRRIRVGGKVLPAGVRLGGAVVLLALIGWGIVSITVRNIGHLVAAAPVYEQNLRQLLDRVAGALGVDAEVQALLDSLRVSRYLRGFAGALTYLVGHLAAVAIYALFLLMEQHSFSRKIAALFPEPERQGRVYRMLQRMGAEVQAYVWLKTLMSLLPSVISYVVMKLAGLDLAEFWAMLIFAMNYIPYIGAWMGVVVPTLVAAVQFGALEPVLWMAAGLGVVQFTTGSIMEPRIMGKGLNLSPVVMLLSLAFWGTVWGVVGMFLAVPLMVVIMIVCSHVESLRPVAVLMSANGELRN